jgi:hypothetical protein
MPLSHAPTDGPDDAEALGRVLVLDYLNYCEGDPEVLSVDRATNTLTAQWMYETDGRSVVVHIDPLGMVKLFEAGQNLASVLEDLASLRRDPAYREFVWGDWFLSMMEEAEIMRHTFRSIRLTPRGRFEGVEPRERTQ